MVKEVSTNHVLSWESISSEVNLNYAPLLTEIIRSKPELCSFIYWNNTNQMKNIQMQGTGDAIKAGNLGFRFRASNKGTQG